MANVLIVDDSRTSRKMLTNIIEEIGHTITGEAVNGEDGYMKFRELRPDLVTLDITMPKMNGLEALQLILNEDKDARVIIISSASQKDKMLKALKMGAKEFVAKPLDDEMVQEAVTRVLEGNAQGAELVKSWE